ncbi:MAG: hypothetical protein HZA91_01935 [Verrucomicrobia bacterium]|nr:hypothetical protein [Verrucomicrobiota bacterium]
MSRDSRPFPQSAPIARQELDTTLDAARQQIVALQRKKDELERAKGELEEMRRRHEEFARGRAEIVEALNRGLVVLEHEQVEAQRMADLIARTREKFKEQLGLVETLDDSGWSSETLKSDLSRALATIETARMEFNSACLRIEALSGKKPEDFPPTPLQQMSASAASLDTLSFGRALKLGLAFTLPLVALALLILLVVLLKR